MSKTIKLDGTDRLMEEITAKELKRIQASYKKAWEELLKKEKAMHLSDNSLQKRQIIQ